MDFKKIGAETILAVIFVPVVVTVFMKFSDLEKANAVHDVRYEHILEKLQTIEDNIKEMKDGSKRN